jgi:hypothetical protein
LGDARFAQLRDDSRFWDEVEAGNVQAALERDSFARLADDARIRRKAADLGLVAESAAFDAGQFRESFAPVLEQIGPRLRGLHADPALRELLADPAVIAKLQSGDMLGLLAHPRFRELVSRLSGDR